ncbi:hypothetical protein KC352_g41652, partial [Hortaea werneckii]
MGVKKIGSVGYCFGAKYVARFGAKGKGIDVGCMAHPSFVDAEELKAMVAPLSIAAAETDAIFPAEKRRESEDILKDMDLPYQMSLYSDVEHGFAVRADLSNKRAKFAKEAAFLQHVQWFDEFVKGQRDIAAEFLHRLLYLFQHLPAPVNVLLAVPYRNLEHMIYTRRECPYKVARRLIILLLSFFDIQRQELDPTADITSPYHMPCQSRRLSTPWQPKHQPASFDIIFTGYNSLK